ncbi:MAG: riboflavin biosynthesis protein RibF [Acidobacteria bacterium]|nr:riboflavin biosynthesis protein RibF [Acidobacteriota bacterium]MYF15241.1 riboflavin biosynthesis protein RibF [Acidobacteriota bacterium]MYI97757.1 riboflavin biosynthesis protein RibF [Acidobacteriota bacterium]
MKIERLHELPPAPDGADPGAPARPAVVAVGNFDGVHRGHRMGLQLAREEARARDAECVAVTFDPHPARLLRPDRAPKTITSFALKAERLAAAGVERLIVLEFGEAMARTSPADFVSRLLVERLGAVTVVQGANFRFGRGRAGDLETLRALGDRHGFGVIEAPSVSWEGAIVSSTRIRRTLAEGNIEAGAALLGAFYEIDGAVVSGRGRGQGLGFPTANLAPEGDVLVPHGVYAVDAVLTSPGDGLFRAVLHYGPRPTFDDSSSLEVHLMGFSGEVSHLRVRFLSHLRDVRAFPGPESLKTQLERDVARARDLAAFSAPEAGFRATEAAKPETLTHA